MKTKFLHALTPVLAAAGALLLASCQGTSDTPTSAVSCSKCGTVSFKAPSTSYGGAGAGNKGYITLHDSRRMSCPDCDNILVSWAKTGHLTKHVCTSCGGSLRHCTRH